MKSPTIAKLRPTALIVLVIGMGLISSREASAQQYAVTDLGKLGGKTSQATGITDDSRIAGWSETNLTAPNGTPLQKPFLWQRGFKVELPTLAPGRKTVANAISRNANSGSFFHSENYTGEAETSTGAIHAYFYRSGFSPSMVDLGTLPNTTESHGSAVNWYGSVAGWAVGAGSVPRAFVYGGGVGLVDISNGLQSAAYGINDSGQVVGYALTKTAYHVFRYDMVSKQWQDLGSAPGYSNSYGRGINQAGDIVGYASLLPPPFTSTSVRGFVYRNGTYQLIGNVDNIAVAINSSGQVVGNLKTPAGDRAYIYITQKSQLTDLNTLISPAAGWVLKMATGINSAGQIVGVGSIGGEDHAFLLTPIPATYTVIELPLKTGLFIPDSLRINNRGQVAGESVAGRAAIYEIVNGQPAVTEVGPYPSHAYSISDLGAAVGEVAGRATYFYGNSTRDLGDLGGGASVAFGINNSDEVVGKALVGVYDHAFLRTSTAMRDLGLPSNSYRASAATSINDFEQVLVAATGISQTTGAPFQNAFVWTANTPNTGMTILPSVAGAAFDNMDDEAWDINNPGTAVGLSKITFQGQGSVAHAVLWTQDPQGQWGVTDLGSPQGVRTGESKASGINNAGQIVGYSNINANGAPTPSYQHHAFMWVNNTMIDLNGRVPAGTPLLINAIDINDSGQIIALAPGDMDARIFLLTR